MKPTESKTISLEDKPKKNSSLRPALAACMLIAVSACAWGGCGPIVVIPPVQNSMTDEFVGPFSSWKNVKTEFGAEGNGMANDTAAIQRAIDSFCNMHASASSVLYFPPGTYRITNTIRNLSTLPGCIRNYNGFTIVGDDPDTTIIQWDGPIDYTMLHLDATYAKVSRLSFEGQGTHGTAGIGIFRGDSFSTASELSDLRFRNMKIGVQMGTIQTMGEPPNVYYGQAEHAIFRCWFQNCSDAGVYIPRSNSLDIWVWRSQFDGCKFGVHSDKGNFHVYDSAFQRSTDADIYAENIHTFAFVNNISVGSKTFLRQNPQSHGSRMLVQGNRIFNWTGAYAVETAAAGTSLLLDNWFQPDPMNPNNVAAVQLEVRNHILVGNRFTSGNQVDPTNPLSSDRRRIIDSQVVDPITLPAITPPQAPPKVVHVPFEPVSGTGDDAKAIQEQIDLAAAEPLGTRPVVHIPKGEWKLARPLIVPANTDMQIIGDGVENGTMLHENAQFPANEAALQVEGPSHAVLRDFEVIGGDVGNPPLTGDGILIKGVDQAGGRIYMEQVNARNADSTVTRPAHAIFVDGVEDSDITFLASGFSGAGTGLEVRGGPKRAVGLDAPGLVAFISGASSATGKLYDVVNGGTLLAEAVWYEGEWFTPAHPGEEIIADLEDTTGSLTLAAMHFAVPIATNSPVLHSKNHSGNIAVLVSLFNQQQTFPPAHFMEFAGNGDALRTLMLGDTFVVAGLVPNPPDPNNPWVDVNWVWKDNTTSTNMSLYFPQLHSSNTAYLSSNTAAMNLPNVTNQLQGQDPSDNHILDMLKPLRNKRIEAFHDSPDGAPNVTSLGLFRVFARAGTNKTALEIRR